jgi:hypothetical protein
MKTEQILNNASGGLFFSAFMLSKLQYIPLPLVSAIFRFISLGLYMLGYVAWFFASYFQQEHKEHQDKWYGFAKIKEQFLLSSFIGFIGALVSIGAVFLPILLPFAAALFLLGNIIWAIGEFHKYRNPPAHDDNFSLTRQKSYVAYAATATSISFVALVSCILMMTLPFIALPITIFSLVLYVGLGALALEFWLNSYSGNHEKFSFKSSSSVVTDGLGCVYQEDNSPKPGHHKGPLESMELQTMGPAENEGAQPELPADSSSLLASSSV